MYKRRLLGIALAQASTLKGGRAWRAIFFILIIFRLA